MLTLYFGNKILVIGNSRQKLCKSRYHKLSGSVQFCLIFLLFTKNFCHKSHPQIVQPLLPVFQVKSLLPRNCCNFASEYTMRNKYLGHVEKALEMCPI